MKTNTSFEREEGVYIFRQCGLINDVILLAFLQETTGMILGDVFYLSFIYIVAKMEIFRFLVPSLQPKGCMRTHGR